MNRPLVVFPRVVLTLVTLLYVSLLPVDAAAQQKRRTQNVILVTLDGVRWQEVFNGVDSALVHDTKYTPASSATHEQFWTTSLEARRRQLMPFLWDSLATAGQLYGNRNEGSLVDVTNPHRFSYPGYSELLTGYADARVASNAKIANPNRTVLEYLNEQPALRGRVAAFGSWDVFPYIINEERSGILVNAGLESATGNGLTPRELLLNELITQLPAPWPGIRHDALTQNYALEYLQRVRPRVLYIALDETDDFAHDEQYHSYVRAVRRADDFIRALWQWVQATEGYRNVTTLIVTTDHGRGNGQRWSDHGRDVEGAQHIWIAAIGPDTPANGMMRAGQYYQNQIARTIATLLGYEYAADARIGASIDALFTF